MTTLALVGGMLPLAFGNGPGAEERRAVAVVIGGQSMSLLLTLIVTPVAFVLLEHARARLRTEPMRTSTGSMSTPAVCGSELVTGHSRPKTLEVHNLAE